MSQRTEKVESLVMQLVASFYVERLPELTGRASVTAVDVSPDLRHAIIWLDILGNDKDELMKLMLGERAAAQSYVAKNMTTKFVPRLELKLDAGGEYAAKMDRLMRGL